MPVSLQDTPTGQIRVETGLGRITNIDDPAGRRNAKVTIDAEHLKIPVVGWIDTHGPQWSDAQQAHQLGVRVGYRIEVHRKDGVDVDRPLDDLANTDKVRDLVDLAAVDGQGRPFDAGRALPAAADTPPAIAASTAPPAIDVDATEVLVDPAPKTLVELGLEATAQRQAHRAARTNGHGTGPMCASCGLPLAGGAARKDTIGMVHAPVCPGDPYDDVTPRPADDPEAVELTAAGTAAAAQADELADGDDTDVDVRACKVEGCGWSGTRAEMLAHLDEHVTDAKAAAAPVAGRQRAVADGRRGPRIAEGKPWEIHNSDGSINLGSYAITAAAGTVHQAHDLLLARHAVDVANGGEADPVTPAKVRALAAALLDAADRVQATVRGDGRVDRMDNSHTRARGMVRVALDAHPVPWGADVDARAQWVEDLAGYAGELLTVAIQLRDPREG